MKKSLLTFGSVLAVVLFVVPGIADTGSDSTPEFFFTRLIYGNGGHGGGLTARGGIPFGTWTDRYIDWFKDLGFLGKPGKPTKAATDVEAFSKKPAR